MSDFRQLKPRKYGSTPQMIARSIAELRGLKEAAHVAGKSKSSMALYSDPDARTSVPHEVVRELVRAGAREPVEDFARLAGGHFEPAAAPSEPTHVLIGQALTEAAQLARLALDIGSTGALGGLPLLQEADELVKLAVAVRSRIMADIEGQ